MLPSKLECFTIVLGLCCFVLVQTESTWKSFRLTWGLNLFSSQVFSKMPKTENEARSEGFVKLDGECSGGKFLGRRYIKGLDTAAVLIYDENGYIAGIQNGIPKTDVEKVNTTYSFEGSSAYQLDNVLGEEVYFVTAYFVDPNIICNGGRTEAQFEEQGVGTGLHLQNGSDPIRNTVEVPLYEKDMKDTQWVKGGCFRTMGIHYWYKTHEDMKCSDFFPVTVVYNRDKVTSFCFASFGKYEFSRRFEHPCIVVVFPGPCTEMLRKRAREKRWIQRNARVLQRATMEHFMLKITTY